MIQSIESTSVGVSSRLTWEFITFHPSSLFLHHPLQLSPYLLYSFLPRSRDQQGCFSCQRNGKTNTLSRMQDLQSEIRAECVESPREFQVPDVITNCNTFSLLHVRLCNYVTFTFCVPVSPMFNCDRFRFGREYSPKIQELSVIMNKIRSGMRTPPKDQITYPFGGQILVY